MKRDKDKQLEIYHKALKVIWSCKNIAHIIYAKRFVVLAQKNRTFMPIAREVLTSELFVQKKRICRCQN